MKNAILSALAIILVQQLMAQSDTSTLHETTSNTGKLWSVGFLVAFTVGIAIYFIIKKNPKKDAIR